MLKPISELLPELFEVDPPRVNGDDPVILAGSYLKHNAVHMLPGGTKLRPQRLEPAGLVLYPAFGSYGILKRIAESARGDYYRTLWLKSAEVPVWIGSCSFDDPFDDVFESFSVTRFGVTRVTSGNKEALVNLGDVTRLLATNVFTARMSTEDVSSVPIGISGESPILEAIMKMFSMGIRRLFLEGQKGRFISDRALVDYLFSPERLEIVRDHPEKWIDDNVSKITTKLPGRCKNGDLDSAAKVMGRSPDDCLMTDDYRVISRWDLAVKPWQAGKMALADN